MPKQSRTISMIPKPSISYFTETHSPQGISRILISDNRIILLLLELNVPTDVQLAIIIQTEFTSCFCQDGSVYLSSVTFEDAIHVLE